MPSIGFRLTHGVQVCLLLALPLTAAEPYTAGDLVRLALERSRLLAAEKQRVAEARGALRQAGLRPPLSLDLGGATGQPLGSPGKEEFSSGVSQAIETGGKRDKRVGVADKAVALAEAEVAERAWLLVGQVRLRHAEALAEQARIAVLEKLAGSHRESLKLMQARVAQGDAAPLEAQLVAVEIGRVESQRRSAAGRLEVALTDLRRLCGLESSAPLSLAGEAGQAPLRTLEEWQKLALDRRPDLAAARAAAAQGEAGKALAASQSKADLTVGARYAFRRNQFEGLYGVTAAGQTAPIRDHDNMLEFGVSIPLFASSRNKGNVEAAEARAGQAEWQLRHLEASIPLEVAAAWQRVEAARASLQLLESDVLAQSEKNLEVIRQAYGLGQLRLLDVLNEQRRVMESSLAAVDARAEVQRGMAELEQAAGGEIR